MIYSTKDKHNMHSIPGEWLIEASNFAFKLRDAGIPVSNVRPAIKGGPYAGYKWAGVFVLTFRPHTYGINTHHAEKYKKEYRVKTDYIANYGGQEVYVYKGSVEKIYSYYKKNIKPLFNRIESGHLLVAMYRRSGLIPKHVAKNHQKRLEHRFGSPDYYTDKTTLNYLSKMLSFYMRHHAKCPYCGKRGFQETILGWSCNACQACYCDFDEPFHWENI